MKSTAEILREARELISTPEAWCKGGNSFSTPSAVRRAPEGNGYRPAGTEPDAVCWCPSGAINRAAGGHDAPGRSDAERAFSRAAGVALPFRFNDLSTTTHADVLAAFDRAIAAVTS